MAEEREMNLEEWCAKLPDSHRVNQQLKRMLDRIDWLECLEAAGVDNWQGIDEAISMRNGEDS